MQVVAAKTEPHGEDEPISPVKRTTTTTTTPAKVKLPLKSLKSPKSYGPLMATKSTFECTLCEERLTLHAGLSPLVHWSNAHSDQAVAAFRVRRRPAPWPTSRGSTNISGRAEQRVCGHVTAANKQSHDAKLQMRRHWEKEHPLLMRREDDYRMTELTVLGYHCQVGVETDRFHFTGFSLSFICVDHCHFVNIGHCHFIYDDNCHFICVDHCHFVYITLHWSFHSW